MTHIPVVDELNLQTYKTLGIRILLTASRLLGSKIKCHKDAS